MWKDDRFPSGKVFRVKILQIFENYVKVVSDEFGISDMALSWFLQRYRKYTALEQWLDGEKLWKN